MQGISIIINFLINNEETKIKLEDKDYISWYKKGFFYMETDKKTHLVTDFRMFDNYKWHAGTQSFEDK